MKNIHSNKNLIKTVLLIFSLSLPTTILAAENFYSSQLVNQSKHSGSNGYKLIKTKLWPNTQCVIESGKQIIHPGESTDLKIKKGKECNESGIGYSIYKVDDTKNDHLLGYLSHRFADGKFSVQISRFCEGKKCVFTDLDPAQSRENP